MNQELAIRLVQDTNWWVVGSQILSAFAIIIAAIVAASFAGKKDRQELKSRKRYLVSLFELLHSNISIFSKGISSAKNWSTAEKHINLININSLRIIEMLDRDLLNYISCMSDKTLNDIHVMIFELRLAKEQLERFDIDTWGTVNRGIVKGIIIPILDLSEEILESQKRFIKPFPCRVYASFRSRREKKKALKKQKRDADEPSEPQPQTQQS